MVFNNVSRHDRLECMYKFRKYVKIIMSLKVTVNMCYLLDLI